MLRDILPTVSRSIEPWVAPEISSGGARSDESTMAAIQASDVGIISVTAENQRSPWLKFDAIALLKHLPQDRLFVLLVDLSAADLEEPFVNLRSISLDRSALAFLFDELGQFAEATGRISVRSPTTLDEVVTSLLLAADVPVGATEGRVELSATANESTLDNSDGRLTTAHGARPILAERRADGVRPPHPASSVEGEGRTPAEPRVFISYRRRDDSGLAGRLYDRLASHFGDAQIFMDVDTIALGLDFGEVISRALSTSRVVIVVIGPGWLSARDADGRRRLDDPDDLVRIEIATALELNVRVIPVLVGGATMPHAQELPETLVRLARRHALSMRHESFRSDADRLVMALGPILINDV